MPKATPTITITVPVYGSAYKRVRASFRHSINDLENKMLKLQSDFGSIDTDEDTWQAEALTEMRNTYAYYQTMLQQLNTDYKVHRPYDKD